jgi:hypothetical protein
MKAHRVKCQLCAHGVTIVTAAPLDFDLDGESPFTEVFAGALDDDKAKDRMSAVIAEQENDSHKAILEGEELAQYEDITADQIKTTYKFVINSMPIRA